MGIINMVNDMAINQFVIILEFCLGMTVLAGLLLLLGRMRKG
jgi:hypothetical protein